MRKGNNDAVESYHNRLQSFPDLLLASLFGFQPLGFIRDEPEPPPQ